MLNVMPVSLPGRDLSLDLTRTSMPSCSPLTRWPSIHSAPGHGRASALPLTHNSFQAKNSIVSSLSVRSEVKVEDVISRYIQCRPAAVVSICRPFLAQIDLRYIGVTNAVFRGAIVKSSLRRRHLVPMEHKPKLHCCGASCR